MAAKQRLKKHQSRKNTATRWHAVFVLNSQRSASEIVTGALRIQFNI
jgi:hypothetical protein